MVVVTFDNATLVKMTTEDEQSGIYNFTMAKDTGAETYTATFSVLIGEEDKEARAYIYTYVNVYNEEGPPSPPTVVTTGTTVDVSMTGKTTTETGYAPMKEIRIYRTPTGSGIADYFYVGAVSVIGLGADVNVPFNDNVKPELLNEPISSTYFYASPANLSGLIALPNGILMAWRGNELWFCEAYKPWAWNPNNTKPLTHVVVGAIAHGSGAVVTTLANPFLVSGVSPDSMTAARINVSQAGVSKWSIAAVDGVVAYASHDGIVTLAGATGSLSMSERFFTRDVWRNAYKNGLDTMQFSVWDGRLVVFSRTQEFGPFMIRLDEAAGTLTDIPDLVAWCGFISPESDQFYYTAGAYLYQFNGGSVEGKSASWTSREMILPNPENYGAAEAVVTSGSWTIEFYADGVLRKSKGVTTGTTPFRLPGGFMATRWQVRIYGSGRFKELRVARTPNQLRAV